jgi:hypothetical protein
MRLDVTQRQNTAALTDSYRHGPGTIKSVSMKADSRPFVAVTFHVQGCSLLAESQRAMPVRPRQKRPQEARLP